MPGKGDGITSLPGPKPASCRLVAHLCHQTADRVAGDPAVYLADIVANQVCPLLDFLHQMEEVAPLPLYQNNVADLNLFWVNRRQGDKLPALDAATHRPALWTHLHGTTLAQLLQCVGYPSHRQEPRSRFGPRRWSESLRLDLALRHLAVVEADLDELLVAAPLQPLRR